MTNHLLPTEEQFTSSQTFLQSLGMRKVEMGCSLREYLCKVTTAVTVGNTGTSATREMDRMVRLLLHRQMSSLVPDVAGGDWG